MGSRIARVDRVGFASGLIGEPGSSLAKLNLAAQGKQCSRFRRGGQRSIYGIFRFAQLLLVQERMNQPNCCIRVAWMAGQNSLVKTRGFGVVGPEQSRVGLAGWEMLDHRAIGRDETRP